MQALRILRGHDASRGPLLPQLDAAHNLARWLVRDATTAEDVLQEAMLRALTYFPSFRGDNPRAWLLQIVRNTAYDALKLDRDPRFVPLCRRHGKTIAAGSIQPLTATTRRQA